MVHKLFIALIVFIQLSIPPQAFAQIKSSPINSRVEPAKNPNVLFEGYSKILLAGQHVGFTVLRYEFNPKTKRFIATYLIKTNASGGNILEGLKAVADKDLKPISYEYTAMVDKKTKVIDAKFSKNRMTATVKDGKDTKKLVNDVPKGSFLAIFLYYVILRSPSGLKTETKYDYKAIAEEDGKIYDGVAAVGKEEKFNGIRAFKASNTFKNVSYTFYITDTGEALMTETPGSNIKTILVAKPEEAIADNVVPASIYQSLFGGQPQGQANIISRNLKAESIRRALPTPTKKEGLPEDPKIMFKKQEDSATSKGRDK